ncbi:serine hydrolase domain-containing protein [Fulvivirgaceae bacterium BMA10]|uniref:Serine hydrolase domain-containing protein n=1 Tax=Splendidivirga corallicola TaxID=3051826 RepID=A0ABT8KS75_9BACT|nr:serine hydrolase domain-containing protein [Fulvivirgaceae bacterium BMA10]
MKKLTFVLFLVLAIGACSDKGKDKNTTNMEHNKNDAVLESALLDIMEKHQLLGLSVLIVRQNEITFEGNYGKANLKSNLEISEETMYRVASISKSVTATALMILFERGFFDLDDDINQYLGFKVRNPRYPEKPITFRMLLSHTSSLVDGEGYGNFLGDIFIKDIFLKDLLLADGIYYTDDMFLDHEPGTYFTYSNVAWGLIGCLIEEISGQRFDVFCEENIFEPLAMEAVYNNVWDIENIANLATLYRTNSGQWVPQVDDFVGKEPRARDLSQYLPGSNAVIFGPQGGLRCSAKDLAKFMLMHLNNGIFEGTRILNDTTVVQMHKNQWKYESDNGDHHDKLMQAWGLGFHLTNNGEKEDVVFPDVKMVGHPGEAYGLISGMYFDKVKKNGVIFMTNGSQEDFQVAEGSAFYQLEHDIYEHVFTYISTN